MPVTLVNLSTRPFVFTKYHDVYCAATGSCACSAVTYPRAELSREGDTKRYRDKRLVPADLTVPAEGRLHGLDEAVLKLPAVQRAMAVRPRVIQALVVQVTGTAPRGPVADPEVKGDRKRSRTRTGFAAERSGPPGSSENSGS